jgi:hypothetical protein
VCSWLLLVATAALSVWLSARVLRIGMLRYGQSLSVRAIFRAIRAQATMKGLPHA